MTVKDELLLDILQEHELDQPHVRVNDVEREELETLLALYHMSSLKADADSNALDAMPDTLQTQLLEQGEAFIDDQQANIDNVVTLPTAPVRSNAIWSQRFVMAACVLLAIVAWYPRMIERLTPPVSIEQTVAVFAGQANTVKLPWQVTEDKASQAAQGQLLWDQAEQKGYMRFTGLAANNPEQYQYQLWIFDKTREGSGHPVDGGVFDIRDSQQETIVAIDAKLLVGKPYLFAVTIEKPGGVVVSKQERIVLLAKNGV